MEPQAQYQQTLRVTRRLHAKIKTPLPTLLHVPFYYA
jgi:hypothetical protein